LSPLWGKGGQRKVYREESARGGGKKRVAAEKKSYQMGWGKKPCQGSIATSGDKK